ncbi:hypothetical protein D3C81_1628280 [compost metagenome]
MQRVTQALRVGQLLARLGFLRQVQAVTFDVGVGGIEQGQVVFVATADVVRQVVLEAGNAIGE